MHANKLYRVRTSTADKVFVRSSSESLSIDLNIARRKRELVSLIRFNGFNPFTFGILFKKNWSIIEILSKFIKMDVKF